MVVSLIVAAVIAALDQLTKFLLYSKSFSLIGEFLWIESVLNRGASFGMMQNGTLFFIIMTIPIVAAIIYIICSKKYLNTFGKLCLGIILGGTVGNFIDRIAFGGVRDFIYFKSIGFPIFNVADIAITVGTAMFIIALVVAVCKKKPAASSIQGETQPETEASGGEEVKSDVQNDELQEQKLEALKQLRDELKEQSGQENKPQEQSEEKK